MADNQKCTNCGKVFHWCPSCQIWTYADDARCDGYCSAVCAIAADPDWVPHDEGEYEEETEGG